MSKKWYIFLLLVLCVQTSVTAKPFVSVNRVDTTNFPQVEVLVNVSNLFYQPFRGLNERNFLIKENGWTVHYVQTLPLDNTNYGKDIVIAIDTSRRIHKKSFKKLKQAAAYLIDSLRDNDRVALVSFDSGPFLHANFTQDKSVVKTQLFSLKQKTKTSRILDGLYFSLKLVQPVASKRKAVVAFGGYKDKSSTMSADDVIGLAGRTHVAVYNVGHSSKYKDKTLARVARKSGGEYIGGPNEEEVLKLFSMVGSVMEYQYILKYRSLLPQATEKQRAQWTKGNNLYDLDIEVAFQHEKLRDQDRLSAEVKYEPSWRMHLGGDLFLFILGLVILIIVLVIVLIILRKDKVQFTVTPTQERELRKALEESYESRFTSEIDTASQKAAPQIDGQSYQGAFIQERQGKLPGRKVNLYWDTTVIGADAECSIHIEDEMVSAKHCKIKRIRGKYVLFDLVSENGVYLNDKKLLRPKALGDFDEFRIGQTIFLFRGRGSHKAPTQYHAHSGLS